MKATLAKFCFVLFTFFSSIYIYAQTVPESFIKKYNAAKTNRQKGETISAYLGTNNDSIKPLCLNLLSYFNKQEDITGKDYTMLYINFITNNAGEFSNALKESLEILERFKKDKDDYGKMWALSAVAQSYATSKNYLKAIEYYKQEIDVAMVLKDSTRYVNAVNDIGYTYSLSNTPDSGIAYAQLAIKLSPAYHLNLAYPLSTLGEIYIAKKQFEKALVLLRESDGYLINDSYASAAFFNDYIDCFIGLNEKDSVLHYAQLAIDIARKNEFNEFLYKSYEKLYQFFDKTNNADSSNKYFRLATTIKDSIYNIEKIKIVESLSFNQQLLLQEEVRQKKALKNEIKFYSLLVAFIIILVIAIIFYRNNKQKQKSNALLQHQKEKVENTLSELKSTQQQLIQSEKMASLGELTAGIAHEIQNPLNFVNNFSEVNKEMIAELKDEIDKGNYDDAKTIANDIEANSEKINHHGKRADAIVKGMLQHSRQTSGTKEPTDINALCDEYLRLSYHGLRAKDKSFNADYKTNFDESVGKINIVPQDIGRVLLNLFNNAFYAVSEKKKLLANSYQPVAEVKTRRINNKVEITVSDNGNGIPQNIIDKIFQPFFTTKPTGQGTGLGLSLAYDIVTKEHNGSLKVESKEGEGSVFIIQLPIA